MDKLVLDITESVRHQKQGLKALDVSDIGGTSVVKLRGLHIENNFFNTQLPLNEDDNNFEEHLNDIN